MDNIGEFREWLLDFVERNGHESHDWLDRRLEKKLAASPPKTKIVVSAPLVLRVLKKQVSLDPEMVRDDLLNSYSY